MNDALGHAYTYRFDLKETPKDYKKVIEDNNIISTYTKKTSINAKTIWLGGPVVKPSTSITLYKNGKAYETVLLNQKNNWSHTWDNLEIYDDKGKLIRYTITQMDVLKDYIASIEGYTITNRYTKKSR